jgi:hypothetical protein
MWIFFISSLQTKSSLPLPFPFPHNASLQHDRQDVGFLLSIMENNQNVITSSVNTFDL